MFQKVDKAHLAKQRSSKGAFSSTSYLRVKPTQMHPKVEQQKSKTDQHEAIGRIGRSRPTQQFIAHLVARLDAKPSSVSLRHRSGVQSRAIIMNNNHSARRLPRPVRRDVVKTRQTASRLVNSSSLPSLKAYSVR